MSNINYLPSNTSVMEVVQSLKQWGAVVIPEFLNPTHMSALRNEFSLILQHKASWIRHLEYRPGWGSMAASVDRIGMDVKMFPETSAAFGSRFMQDVCDSYLGIPNQFNNAIYLTHDLPNEEPVTIMHFDRIYALKFYIYLVDTTIRNGAFEYCPGSHVAGSTARNQFLRDGYAIKDIPIWQYSPNIADSIPVEEKAGSLIIFDTDTIHRGGVVSLDCERLIMRGHSHIVKSYSHEVFNPR
jgi:hypothetical protein